MRNSLVQKYWLRQFPTRATDIAESVQDKKRYASQIIHVRQLASQDYLRSYHGSIVYPVLNALKPMDRIIMDFGCWSGITSLFLNKCTWRSVVGVEINSDYIDFADKYIADKSVTFTEATPDRISVDSDSIDLIVVNQVFCNMYHEQHEVMLSEFVRTLRKGGRLIIVDSNNPENPDVVSRLKALYAKLEGTDGPYRRERQRQIDQLLPNSAPNTDLASATCYHSLDAIREIVRNPTEAPKSYFDPDSLRPPVSMQAPIGAPSSPTPPRAFVDHLTSSGMQCALGPSFPPKNNLVDEASFYIVAHKT